MHLESLLEMWKLNRSFTQDILKEVSPELLKKDLPRPGLNTILKHIEEMLSVEECYVQAMSTGVMDWSNFPDTFSFLGTSDPSELLRKMDAAADRLTSIVLKGEYQKFVKWEDESMSIEIHMTNLITHEILHHGQFIAFMYVAGIPIPESLAANWALTPQDASKAKA